MLLDPASWYVSSWTHIDVIEEKIHQLAKEDEWRENKVGHRHPEYLIGQFVGQFYPVARTLEFLP